MDGGGRFAQPLTAGFPARAAARATTIDAFFPSFPSPSALLMRGLPLRWPRAKRRRSVAVPIESRVPRFLGTGLTLGFFGVVTLAGLASGGHFSALEAQYGAPHHALARMAGLGLDHVKVAGLSQLRASEVLAAAGIDGRTSLAFLSVGEVRERLERIPLVKSAAVRKLYPNELVVTLTERTPHAIWQRDGELLVVAEDGTPLDLVEDGRFNALPFVVGEEANRRTREYAALLEAAGPLKGRIRAGTLVSGRRWTLKMDNGLDVRLPELGAADALARLVKLEREQHILDKDVLAVDLRMPDRVVVRLSEEAASARADAQKKKPTRGKGVDT
ncbi:MAG TPA: cell division protein FtsQ/DivIB [Microvirga sp.]|jgi:cell division protein FtsQ|nr:cell division protein FtsQ/DivIB [Microvirga sp.]